MAGAWGWYCAVLRTIYHVGMHGTVFRRTIAQGWHNELLDRLRAWAADPRTTPAMIRQALDDVVACESLAPSESYPLKAEYLDVDRLARLPDGPTRRPPASWSVLIPAYDIGLTPERTEAIYAAWRAWRREPERSRRVMRLAIANWLALLRHASREAPEGRPPRLVDASSSIPSGPRLLPMPAHAVAPIAGRLARFHHRRQLPVRELGLDMVRMTEQANRRALLILLGEELYRRDHGDGPPTPEALVGPYLKSLPARRGRRERSGEPSGRQAVE